MIQKKRTSIELVRLVNKNIKKTKTIDRIGTKILSIANIPRVAVTGNEKQKTTSPNDLWLPKNKSFLVSKRMFHERSISCSILIINNKKKTSRYITGRRLVNTHFFIIKFVV